MNLKKTWKSFKNIPKIKKVIEVIINSYGCIRSAIIYYTNSIKKPGTFYGYHNYYWACKYADKRTNKWKRQWNQAGRKQGVCAIGDTVLFVCSPAELKMLKKHRVIDRNINPRKAIKKSYYVTA